MAVNIGDPISDAIAKNSYAYELGRDIVRPDPVLKDVDQKLKTGQVTSAGLNFYKSYVGGSGYLPGVIPNQAATTMAGLKLAEQAAAKKSAGDGSDSDVKSQAEKEYTDAELNVLTASISLVPSEEVLSKLALDKTVEVSGVGKYLSLDYYTTSVTISVNNAEGMSITAEAVHMGFGSSVKPKSGAADKSGVQQRKYVLKKGDNLWKLANKYYGDGSQYTKIAQANNIAPSQYRSLPIGMEVIIP